MSRELANSTNRRGFTAAAEQGNEADGARHAIGLMRRLGRRSLLPERWADPQRAGSAWGDRGSKSPLISDNSNSRPATIRIPVWSGGW